MELLSLMVQGRVASHEARSAQIRRLRRGHVPAGNTVIIARAADALTESANVMHGKGSTWYMEMASRDAW